MRIYAIPTYLFALTALVLVLFVSSAYLPAFVSGGNSVTPEAEFPERLQERLLLPDSELREVRRTVSYAADNFTKVKAEVEFADGSSGYLDYRPDGTVAAYAVFYPVGADETGESGSKAQLKMEAEFEDDGIHYRWEKHYFENGILRRSGLRLASGNYEVKEYLEDGVQLAGNYVFDAKGEIYSDVEYYANGVTKKLVKVDKANGTEITLFNEQGLKTSYHKVRYSEIVLETYRADGVTPDIRFEQKAEGSQFSTSYYIYATYYKPDGSVDHERKFGRHYMHVTFRDDQGNVVFRQQYKAKNGGGENLTSLEPDHWYLEGVMLGDQYDYGQSSYWFHEDGSFMRHVYPSDPSNPNVGTMSVKSYHPDGSLQSYRRPDPANAGKWLQDNYKPGEKTEPFDMDLLEGRHLPVPYVVPSWLPPETESHYH